MLHAFEETIMLLKSSMMTLLQTKRSLFIAGLPAPEFSYDLGSKSGDECKVRWNAYDSAKWTKIGPGIFWCRSDVSHSYSEAGDGWVEE